MEGGFFESTLLDFEEFQNMVVENIKDYLPEKYAEATVSLQKVIKNNDVNLTGLMVMTEDSNIAPNIYLDEYYEEYIDGGHFSDILQDIADMRVKNEVVQVFDVSMLTEFEKIKDRVFCKLINGNMNEAYLADKPYMQVEDLAAIYIVDLGKSEDGHMSVPITKNLMGHYGISLEELHDVAIQNLAKSQIEFKSMRDMLIELMFPNGLPENDPRVAQLPPQEDMPLLYVLTNAEKINGAAAILDSKIMGDISDKLGGDFVVIPSSIHEVLVMPIEGMMDRMALETMIQDVNASQVDPVERLSDHAYQYDSQRRVLVRMDKMEEYKKNENKGGENNMSNVEFVTIDLSKKQVDYDSARKNEKNGKDYVRILAPGGGVFFYPLESLKEDADNANRVHFTRPAGTEINLLFSERNPEVPDDAPANEKYTNSTRVVKIEDLKEMYRQERESFAESQRQKYENSPFVNATVPTEWGHRFKGGDSEKEFVSISIPLKEGEERNYYSFVLPAEAFKESTKEEGMSYFGFPRKKKDTDEDYTVTLKRGEKQQDGTYKDVVKEISSEELVKAIKAAQEWKMLNIEVSEKLLHKFNSHEGTPLVSVSVPVFDEALKQNVFYSFVLSESGVSAAEKEGKMMISISEDHNYTAKRGVLDEASGKYNDIEKKMSGAEIEKAFKESSERYMEQMANESIQNEQAEREAARAAQGQEQTVNTARSNCRRGR